MKSCYNVLLAIGVLCWVLPNVSKAQQVSYYLTIANDAYIPQAEVKDTALTLTFPQSDLTATAAGYTITAFRQAYPASRFEYLQHVFFVTASSASFFSELISKYPHVFVDAKEYKQPESVFTPNDYGKVYNNVQTELDLINAKLAWDIDSGNANVVIGLADDWIDKQHPELLNKFVNPNTNWQASHFPTHGIAISGAIAGRTNNDTGLSAIGYLCRMQEDSMGDMYMHRLSSQGLRIVNGSYVNLYEAESTFNLSGRADKALVFDEIYENGTFAVVASGNGNLAGTVFPCQTCYQFPASHDHNMSVSAVGHLNSAVYPYSTANLDTNIKDYHVYYYEQGPSQNPITATHNDRVDICAPGYDVKCIDVIPHQNYTQDLYAIYSGTSLAAPMVSGTAGLMLHRKPCLSPYQMEYILKTTARPLDTIQANIPYAGLLGSGRLDAYQALLTTSGFNCNNATLQTMYISGIGFNTRCAPTFNTANSVLPTFVPMIVNGHTPYTYRWLALPGNTTTLNDSTIGNPQITTSYGTHLAYYLLTVTDGSAVPKVASHIVKMQLDTVTTHWDLAMRDSYFDMLEEPNHQMQVDARDYDIWHSPDVWNRKKIDSDSLTPDNAEFFTVTNTNFMFVRVRNVGCASSPSSNAKVKLYWTLASTGEKWDGDWKTRNLGTIPAGRQVTDTTNGIHIPQLDPGDTFVTNQLWRPINPKSYPSPYSGDSLDLCLLARIETASGPSFGMDTTEVKNVAVTQNVRRLNNVVTRNTMIKNLNRQHAKVVGHLEIANAEPTSQIFNIQLAVDKDIHKHFAGNVSDFMYATVSLGDLFDRWQDNGGKGNYAAIDRTAKNVTYDPSIPLRLDSVTIDSGEHFPVAIEFSLRDSVTIDYPVSTGVHLRQFTANDGKEELYGNVSYIVNIDADSVIVDDGDDPIGKPAPLEQIQHGHTYSIFPNPVANLLYMQYGGKEETVSTITITDMTGRIVYTRSNALLQPGYTYSMNTANIASGIYYVHIRDNKGTSETFKLTKQ